MSGQAAVEPVYFGIVDYIMLALMLSVSMAIGIYFAVTGKRKETKLDYLLGNRKMGALPVCLSLFATFHSAIPLLGIPAEIYTFGIMIVYNIPANLMTAVVAIFTIIPLMYPLKLTSVFEYIERRFDSRGLRLMGTVVGVVSLVSFMAINIFAPALALETVVGLPLWLSIVVIGGICTIYTAIGGIKTVIWTDVFQTIVIFGGMVVILIKGCIDVGGMDRAWQIASDAGRTVYDDFNPDPRVRHTVWGLLIGQFVYGTSFVYSQSSVQRISSIKSMRDAKLSFAYAIPVVLMFYVVLAMTGIVLLAYFFTMRCDPLAAGYIGKSNQLMPYFVMHTLSFLPGLPGIYMASIFSGALSTISSGINALAANTVEDFLGGVLANKKETTVTAISKIIVCLYGAGIIALAFLARGVTGPVTQTTYSALGATAGPILGLFLLAATFPQANKIGSALGLLIGLVFTIWKTIGSLLFGSPPPILPLGPTDRCSTNNSMSSLSPNAVLNTYGNWSNSTTLVMPTPITAGARDVFSLYDLSYLWNPVIGVLLTCVPGLILSLITGPFIKNKPMVDPCLLFPCVRRIWSMEMPEEDNEDEEMQHQTETSMDLKYNSDHNKEV